MPFLRNAWYIAALSKEIEGTALIGRTLLGEGVLIYRLRSGECVALRDRCPHRFAPLHMGTRVDDDVVCPYHALRFDPSGRCVHNPHGNQKIPAAAKVHRYRTVERYGLLWIWMGEPERADDSKIVDCSRLEIGHPNGVAYGYMRFDANYKLIVENILDLSHADHVHGLIISTRGELSKLIPKMHAEDRYVTARWDWKQTPAQQVVASFLPNPEAEARQFAEVHWHAPSNMLVTVGATQSADPKDVLQTWDYHFMTPETESSTHYFFASRRTANWIEEDAQYNQLKVTAMLQAFEREDGPLISAIQKEMGSSDFWSLNPVLLSSDPAPVRARRALEKLINEEASAGQASQPGT